MNKEVNLSPPMPQTEEALPTLSTELETASNEDAQLPNLESVGTAEREASLPEQLPQDEVVQAIAELASAPTSERETTAPELAAAESAASLLEQQIAKLQKDIANLKAILGREHFVAAQNEYDNLQQQLADIEQFKCLFTAATYASERIDADRIAMNKETFADYDQLMMQKDNLEKCLERE